MRRTQLYLNEDQWQALHAKAALTGLTISELVRQAVQERYMGKSSRKEAMMSAVGIWHDRTDVADPEAYVRELRITINDSNEFSVTPILIDSDILIEVLRKRDQHIARMWVEIAGSSQPLLVSPVSVAKLWPGVHQNEIDTLNYFLSQLTCVPLITQWPK